jgi:hypothetical protein
MAEEKSGAYAEDVFLIIQETIVAMWLSEHFQIIIVEY